MELVHTVTSGDLQVVESVIHNILFSSEFLHELVPQLDHSVRFDIIERLYTNYITSDTPTRTISIDFDLIECSVITVEETSSIQ